MDAVRAVGSHADNAIGQLRLPFAERTVGRATGSDEPILRHLAVRLAQGRTTNDTR
jgi:hypothetical protein